MKSSVIFVGLVALLATSLPATRSAPSPDFLQDFVKPVTDATRIFLEKILSDVQAYLASLQNAIKPAQAQTQAAVQKLIEDLLAGFKNLGANLVAALRNILSLFSLSAADKEALTAQLTKLEDLLKGLVPGVGKEVVELLKDIKVANQELFAKLIQVFTGFEDLLKKIQQQLEAVVDKLSELVNLATAAPAAGTTTPAAGTTTPAAGTTTPAAGTTTPAAGDATIAAGVTTPVAGAATTDVVGA